MALPLLRTLYARLALGLFLLLLVIGTLFSALSFYSVREYSAAVNQQLNRDLASRLVADRNLVTGDQINHRELERLFDLYMSINPSIEIYLLDLQGRIVSFSANPDKIKRNQVSLQPIQTLLTNPDVYPLPGERGDDLDYLSLRFDAMAQRITAQVSHDLRTPLAAVQGYLETLSLKQDSLDLDQRRRFLAIALGETRRLGQLVDELFELAALDAREKQPNPEGFMMAERVLDNLISNAISHSPAGTKVRVSVAADANGVSIHVSDSGSGIDEQALAHIWPTKNNPRRYKFVTL